MTDAYTWEWISAEVALNTVHRPMDLADAEAFQAARAGHQAGRPSGRSWGLVVDLRNGGIAREDVQAVLKQSMRADAAAGCAAVAFVVAKTVIQMQSSRLSQEAQHAPTAAFGSVDEAIASVEARLAVAV